MNCFIGLSVISPIKSNSSFSSVLTQINHFLTLKPNMQIIPNSNLLIISHHGQKFYLPKNASFIHTHFQLITVSSNEDQEYLLAILECLHIIKENFPSKVEIELYSQNGQVKEWKKKGEQEISRRLISQLKILQQQTKKREMSRTEMEDVLYVLEKSFHKDYDNKLKYLGIKILNEGKISAKLWIQLTEQEVKVIDEMASKQQFQKQAIETLQKIIRYKKQYQSQFQKQNINTHTYHPSQQKEILHPTAQQMKTVFFQLKESINLGRIVALLESINPELLGEKEVKKLDNCLERAGNKYLNDEYNNSQLGYAFGKALEEYWRRRGSNEYGQMMELIWSKAESEGKNTSNMEYISDFEG